MEPKNLSVDSVDTVVHIQLNRDDSVTLFQDRRPVTDGKLSVRPGDNVKVYLVRNISRQYDAAVAFVLIGYVKSDDHWVGGVIGNNYTNVTGSVQGNLLVNWATGSVRSFPLVVTCYDLNGNAYHYTAPNNGARPPGGPRMIIR